MKKEQIEEYIRLNEMFWEECYRVCGILAGQLDDEYGEGMSRVKCFGFEIVGNDDRVGWEGSVEYRGESENYSGSFPLAYLTLSDDELKKIVELRNQLYQHLKAEKRAEEEEKQRLSRKKLYEKLKKEFEV